MNEVVELWQVPHSPVVGWLGSWAAVGRVTMVTPKKLLPVSWQVAQGVPLTAAWFIAVPTKLVVDLWQLAQSAVVGMCPVPCGFGVTPVNAIPVALAA